MKLNSSQRTVLAPSEAVTFSRLQQRHVRIGRLGHRPQQARRDAGEEVPAAPRRQKRHRFLRQLHEVVVGGRSRRGRDSGPARCGSFPGRDWDRAAGRIPARRSRRLAGERLVQQMVEDAAGRARSCRGSRGGRLRAARPAARPRPRRRRRVFVGPKRLRPAACAGRAAARSAAGPRFAGRSPCAGPACAARRRRRAGGASANRRAVAAGVRSCAGSDRRRRGRGIPDRSGSRASSSAARASSVLRCRSSGRSPPLSSCKNWMVNSMSRMPPRPVFTSGRAGARPGRSSARSAASAP